MELNNNLEYKRKSLAKKSVYEVILVISIIIMLIPFIGILYLSIKPNAEILAGDLSIPAAAEWGNYLKAFETIDFGTMIKNTMIIALVTLTAEFVLGIMGSFAISRFKIGKGKLQRFFYTYFIVGLIIPVFLLIYPIYKMNFMLGTLDTLWAVILPYIGWSAPMVTMLLVSAFNTIPASLEEAAVIDGCGTFKLLTRIDRPVIRSAIVTMLIIQFLAIWNEFAVSVIMLTSPEVQTIALASAKFVGIHTTDYGAMAAAVVLLSMPQVAVFSLFQKYVTGDLTAGSVKE